MLALAGCGPRQSVADERVAAGERIFCAHAGQPLHRDCTVDRTTGRDGKIVTLRHPDGAFHRVSIDRDGRVAAVDGASYALVARKARGGWAIATGGDRYVLAATPPTAP